jgi:hypothetical protein
MDVMVIPNRVRVVAAMSALGLAVGLLTLALLAKPTQANAQTEHFNEWVPIASLIANECTGEPVSIEGTVHVVGTTTQDAAGGTHVQGHTNFVGQGVGIASGAEYVVREVQNTHGNIHDFEGDQAPANFTQPYTFHVIRKGSAMPEDDFLLHMVFHITVNANGEVTSEVGEESIECQ